MAPEQQDPFPTDLCRQIGLMAGRYVSETKPPRNDPDWYRKKTYIYSTALAQFARNEWKKLATPKATFLNDARKYEWDSTKNPPYPAYLASEKFERHTVNVSCNPNFYDYADPSGVVSYWIDFANAWLGGGAFTAGFVQEETMCCETPDLANFAAWQDKDSQGEWRSHLKTRLPPNAAVGAGNPAPLLIAGAHRVLNLDSQHNFHGGLESKTFAEVQAIVDKGVLGQAQTFNVLAAAAPDLTANPKHEPTDEATLVDLFNTFVAMFALARQQAGGKPIVVNSGPMGCGAFGNSVQVVFLLQALAAEHVGDCTLKYWAAGQVTTDQVKSDIKTFKDKYFAQGGTLLALLKACREYFSARN